MSECIMTSSLPLCCDPYMPNVINWPVCMFFSLSNLPRLVQFGLTVNSKSNCELIMHLYSIRVYKPYSPDTIFK